MGPRNGPAERQMSTRVMPGEQAVRGAARTLRRAAVECEEVARRAALSAEAMPRTPAGQAPPAFARGDQVSQCALGVHNIGRSGSATCEILNAVANEGWDLVSGSFARGCDKRVSAGHDVASEGITVGYYLFP